MTLRSYKSTTWSAAALRALLLALTAPSAFAADVFVDTVNDVSSTLAACTSARMASVSGSAWLATIDLRVDAATARALARMPSSRRDDWVALHCPADSHSLWRRYDSRHEVRIKVGLEHDSEAPVDVIGSLDCRRYFEHARKLRRLHQTRALQAFASRQGKSQEQASSSVTQNHFVELP